MQPHTVYELPKKNGPILVKFGLVIVRKCDYNIIIELTLPLDLFLLTLFK